MKYIQLAFFCILIHFKVFSQLCGVSVSKGTISPSTTAQFTSSAGSGQRIYYKFYAKKNCSYIFQTCGLTSQDTELEILKDTTFIAKYFNDDFCNLQSYINWICDNNGWYIIYITRYSGSTCKTLNANVQLKYFCDCGIVMFFEPEPQTETIPPTTEIKEITHLYELDGREVDLNTKGILIVEYSDKTREIKKITN